MRKPIIWKCALVGEPCHGTWHVFPGTRTKLTEVLPKFRTWTEAMDYLKDHS